MLKNGYFLGPKKKSYEKIEKRSIQFFLKRESQNTKSPDQLNRTGTSTDYMKGKRKYH